MRKKFCFSAPRDSGQGTGKSFFSIYPGLCVEQSIPYTSVGKMIFLIIHTRREYIRIPVFGSIQSCLCGSGDIRFYAEILQ